MTGITPDPADLEAAFALEVLAMLKKEGKIGRIIIDKMNSWELSGFNVFCGPAVSPWDDAGLKGWHSILSAHPYPRSA